MLGPATNVTAAVVATAGSERDRLLLRTLWATGARVPEVLALRPRDVQRNKLLLPNPRAPGETVSPAPLDRRMLTCPVSSCSGRTSTNWPMTSRCSSRVSGVVMAGGERSLGSRRGRS